VKFYLTKRQEKINLIKLLEEELGFFINLFKKGKNSFSQLDSKEKELGPTVLIAKFS